MEANTTDRRDFIPYPTNRVVGTVGDATNAQAAINALLQAGFNEHDIDILHGEAGAQRLDPEGVEHGFLARFQRTLIRTAGPAEEYTHLMRHVADVEAGRFVIMVLAKHRDQRTRAADILNAHGADFVGFYGRWSWEGLTPDPPASAVSVHDARRETTVVVRGSGVGFVQEISAGSHRLIADEPIPHGGKDTGPTPYDLLLAALGS